MALNDIIELLLTKKEYQMSKSDIRKCITALQLNPQYPIILVGGTNGKGSVCTYLSNFLTAAKYKVGCFTSPHLYSYNERICINNISISDDNLFSHLNKIVLYAQEHFKGCSFGLFKAFTLAAHSFFIEQSIDIAIVEVGIGGLNDITNIFDPTMSVITTIDFDHCKILGNNLEQIGLQKAGILRSNKYGFYGSANPPNSLIAYAKEISNKLLLANIDFGITASTNNSFSVFCQDTNYYNLPYPNIRSDIQLSNIALALAVITKLSRQFTVSLTTIKQALVTTLLPGRFQALPTNPLIIVDVAHNPQAVHIMLQNMVKLPPTKKTIAVFGIAKDKDVDAIVAMCKDKFDKWFIATTSDINRSIQVEDLAEILYKHKITSSKVVQCDSITCAINLAYSETDAKIICFGSFLVVEEAYNSIMKKNK
jgi:dihydrofolate synthase/folylpolyglutamate synthase